MILDVDDSLRRMLATELAQIPGCPVYTQEQITLDAPTEAAAAQDGEARINLFLYDIRENLEQRDESFAQVRSGSRMEAGKRRAPIRMNLSYLVTTHAGQDRATEHRLLGDVMAVLLRYLAVPEQYLSGTLVSQRTNGVHLALAQPEHLELMNPTNLWQALEGQLQPGMPLVVTASFDPFETKWTKVVRELLSAVGQGGAMEGPNRQPGLSSLRASAAGVVVDGRTEQRLSGVTVRAAWSEEAVQSNSEGFFLVLNLPPGPQALHFEKRGYKTLEMTTNVPPTGRPEQMEPLVAALTALTAEERESETAAQETEARNLPSLSESGRVYQASFTGTLRYEDGHPATRVQVSAGSRQTVTDADGIYCFFDLPPGEHVIQATLPGQGEVEIARHIVPPPKKSIRV